MFRKHLPELRQAVEGIYHVWSAGSGALRPVDDRYPGATRRLRPGVAARARASTVARGRRAQPRPRRRLGVAAGHDVQRTTRRRSTWERDGIRYLNPEIVLSFKARQLRSKDEHDFAATVPLLDDGARSWLADYLERCEEPDHPWLDRVRR